MPSPRWSLSYVTPWLRVRSYTSPSPQAKLFKKWGAWAKWVKAGGKAAVAVLERLEKPTGSTTTTPLQLTVDNFRCLRGLLTDVDRRDLTTKATTEAVTKLPPFVELCRRQEKEMWVRFHWQGENTFLNEHNCMHPPAPCGLSAAVQFSLWSLGCAHAPCTWETPFISTLPLATFQPSSHTHNLCHLSQGRTPCSGSSSAPEWRSGT